jgi:O-antigen/teichoic acid export membrane protein
LSSNAVTAPPPETWPAAALSGALAWMFRGAWAILDQGMFALSNFAVNIVVARWLSVQDYGAFTIAYTVFLLLATVHTALLSDPLIVFGAGQYRDVLPGYLAVLMRSHWVLATAASLVLSVSGIGLTLFGQRDVGLALLGLAIANPFILLLWLVRRSCYIPVDPRLAAFGGILYMAILLSGAYLLLRIGQLTPASAFVLMGVGSLASAVWIQSRLPFKFSADITGAFRSRIRSEHWMFGRWVVCAGLVGAASSQAYYVVMPPWHGLESTATLKALTNLVMPAMQSLTALSVMMLTSLVRVRDTPRFGRMVRRLLIVYTVGTLVYWLALGLSHQHVVRWLYGGRYASQSALLWLLGLLPVVGALTGVLDSALRARERSGAIFRAWVLALVSTCVLGIPLALAFGTGGAIVGQLISYGMAVCSMAWSLRRRRFTPAQAT